MHVKRSHAHMTSHDSIRNDTRCCMPTDIEQAKVAQSKASIVQRISGLRMHVNLTQQVAHVLRILAA